MNHFTHNIAIFINTFFVVVLILKKGRQHKTGKESSTPSVGIYSISIHHKTNAFWKREKISKDKERENILLQ